MPAPFYNEAQVPTGEEGEPLRLVLDFRAIDIIESLTGRSMDSILPALVGDPGDSLVTKILWALLREYHPSFTLNDVMGIVVDPKLGPAAGVVVGDLFKRAYNLGDAAGGEAKDSGPLERPGTSEPS